MSAQTNYYAMRPAFELQLNTPLLEGLATIGRFDGRTPSLVCATTTQQLVIHTSRSHETVAQKGGSAAINSASSLRTLSFGKTPTALTVGRVQDAADRKGVDALYFGSATSLLAYDVERNSEYFYKNMEDGVHAMTWGVVNTVKESTGNGNPLPLVIVGGICTINGFDEGGTEMLWTVTGDQVSALALMPWGASNNRGESSIISPTINPSDAPLSLVAASEDFELRVFDGEETIASIVEVEKVNQLVYSGIPGRFAYLSANGTVGVYDRTERVWRAKGKHRPVSAAFCDVDFDGVPELIVGWSNGRLEVRGDDAEKRGVLFKDTYAAPVSAVLAYDYRQNGQPLPVICTVDGTVRGLQLANVREGEEREAVMRSQEAFRLDTLLREKQALADELAIVEEQLARQRSGDTDVTLPQLGTVVRHSLLPNPKTGQLDIVFVVQNGYPDTIIQGCILHSETLFPGKEYAFFTVAEPSTTLVCPVNIERCVEARVTASVMVGATNAENYQLYELSLDIPKFVMYQHCERDQAVPFKEPAGYVTLYLPKEFYFPHLGAWLEETFSFSSTPAMSGDFRLAFLDMRNGHRLVIQGKAEIRELQIYGETMEICGDVVESLGAAAVDEATAVCHFPAEFQELQAAILSVEAFNAVRLKLTSSMADAAAGVKPLLTRAEDSRLMSDITNMRRLYAQLYDLNKELIAENMKRCNNYGELKAALKQLNAYIMKAGRLRIGQAKTRLISDCRDAVKFGDTRSLFSLIRTGQK